MENKPSNVIRSKSRIAYPYATIRITQSRIDKGLIAIPVSLVEWFPDHNENIQVYLNDSPISQTKNYSSYTSSTHECRIGGVRKWFEQNKIKSGDEVVIQLIDKERFIYRLIPENNFIVTTQELQHSFDKSDTEQKASETITTIAEWTHLKRGKIVIGEYYRLSNILPSEERQYVRRRISQTRESVPANLRILLEDIYQGHCQVCDFWFLKRDIKPYFETHHIDPSKGHHLKNVLVVCGNCHNQFEYTYVRHEFSDDRWLIRVAFNEVIYEVKHTVLDIEKEGFFKELFI